VLNEVVLLLNPAGMVLNKVVLDSDHWEVGGGKHPGTFASTGACAPEHRYTEHRYTEHCQSF
jgi:hypothetical protein